MSDKEIKPVWFKNKVTGVEWEVSLPDRIAELEKDQDYEVLKDGPTKKKK